MGYGSSETLGNVEVAAVGTPMSNKTWEFQSSSLASVPPFSPLSFISRSTPKEKESATRKSEWFHPLVLAYVTLISS